MNFAFFGYRSWAFKILQNLISDGFKIASFTIKDTEYPQKSKIKSKSFSPKNIEKLNLSKYEVILFYGWSWIVPKAIVDKKICVCLHPSPLPKYRGGSPIQHQIMNGEEKSAVTLFKMDEGIDTGPIYYQKEFSLKGDLDKIFDRITECGYELTSKLLKDFKENVASATPQNNSIATFYKRRKPGDSELSINKLTNMSAREIHDFIRALQNPYPNAFFVGSDGKKVYLIKSKL